MTSRLLRRSVIRRSPCSVCRSSGHVRPRKARVSGPKSARRRRLRLSFGRSSSRDASECGRSGAIQRLERASYRSVSARAAARAGVRRFVFLSSIKVNGERTVDRPFRAEDKPAPRDAYGDSKWQAEMALRRFSRVDRAGNSRRPTPTDLRSRRGREFSPTAVVAHSE